MAGISETMPEGTDTILDGASSTGAGDSGFKTETVSSTNGSQNAVAAAKAKIGETAANLKSQATDKVHGFASQGKDKATDALDNVAKLVTDAAATVDDSGALRHAKVS